MVREPGGQSVAKMRVDYTSEAGTGVFSQLAVMGPLQGLGIATMLIGATGITCCQTAGGAGACRHGHAHAADPAAAAAPNR